MQLLSKGGLGQALKLTMLPAILHQRLEQQAFRALGVHQLNIFLQDLHYPYPSLMLLCPNPYALVI